MARVMNEVRVQVMGTARGNKGPRQRASAKALRLKWVWYIFVMPVWLECRWLGERRSSEN